VKKVIKLVAAVAIVAAVVEVLRRRPAPPTASPTAPPNQWTPVAQRPGPTEAPAVTPETAAPIPEAEAEAAHPEAASGWVEPNADGSCPDGHPVKAKASSKIFHVPGGAMYDRTAPDRCYVSAEAAEADGFRASQR
jgi:large subunit ribosomal protein L17